MAGSMPGTGSSRRSVRPRSCPLDADEILDLGGHVVLPGLVNTHHHLYQTLTRAVPAAQDADLFDWLTALYPMWARLTPEAVRMSTLVGLAELALSGCTTSSDHLYLYPNGCRLDDAIEAAAEIGLRFHATRGSMSLGESRGGLPPDRVRRGRGVHPPRLAAPGRALPRPVARGDAADRPGALLALLGDARPHARDRDARPLARRPLHTHLAETLDEERFCLETVGCRPVAYMESLGWLGPDTWFAHSVHVDDAEIDAYARSGSGVAHCPTSNMRLASGIAPLQRMRAAGVRVGLGVDGSASNDGSNMLGEVRQALLLARLDLAERRRHDRANVEGDAVQLGAREALEIATLGGASILGRDDIGALAPGMCADFFAVDVRRPAFAGALHDPVAAVVLCAPAPAAFTYVDGRPIVREGRLVTLDLPPVVERHNRLARAMVEPG